jgi:hypothetical protein
MRTRLQCDFFIADEEEADATGQPRLRVFPGPRGIVIADALVPLPGGLEVCRGEAFAVGRGIEFVYQCVDEDSSPTDTRVVAMRFVVKDARYDPHLSYTIRNEHLAHAVS